MAICFPMMDIFGVGQKFVRLPTGKSVCSATYRVAVREYQRLHPESSTFSARAAVKDALFPAAIGGIQPTISLHNGHEASPFPTTITTGFLFLKSVRCGRVGKAVMVERCAKILTAGGVEAEALEECASPIAAMTLDEAKSIADFVSP